MNSQPKRLWWCWLMVAPCAVMILALSMFAWPSLSQGVFNWLVFQQIASPFGPSSTHYIVFVCGIYGVAILSWMLALLVIIAIPFRKGEVWAWRAIVFSMGMWFVLDTMITLVAGFPGNMVLNVGVFVFFAPPLAATYSHFHSSIDGSRIEKTHMSEREK